jgi:hypothetical protein
VIGRRKMIDLEKSMLVCECGGIYNNLNGFYSECSRCERLLQVKQTKQFVKYKKKRILPSIEVRREIAIKKIWKEKSNAR